MLLATRRASLEMRPQPGDRRVRVGARELELDVAVELLEAGLAADLGLCRPEQTARRRALVSIGPVTAPPRCPSTRP